MTRNKTLKDAVELHNLYFTNGIHIKKSNRLHSSSIISKYECWINKNAQNYNIQENKRDTESVTKKYCGVFIIFVIFNVFAYKYGEPNIYITKNEMY